MNTLKNLADRGRVAALALGPYVATALLIPGGSLLAGVVWLYRRRKSARAQQ